MSILGVGAGDGDLSLNGYYLRPTIAYNANRLFGRDEELAELLDNGMKVSFTDMLKTGLGQVNDLQSAADDFANRFMTGETDDIAGLMIAGQKSDVALQLTTAISTKLVSAYQEIMRMQI